MSLKSQPSLVDDGQLDARSSMTGIEMMARSSVHTLGILESASVSADNNYNSTGGNMWKLTKLRERFKNKNLETLYRKYVHRLNHCNLRAYILLQIMTSLAFIAANLILHLEDEEKVMAEVAGQGALFFLTVIFLLTVFKESSVKNKKHVHVVLSVFVAFALIFVDLTLAFWLRSKDARQPSQGRENTVHVPSALFTILVVYNLLPLKHLWQSTVVGLSIGVVHIIKSILLSMEEAGDHNVVTPSMIVADGVYYLTANFVGIYTKCLHEITLRRAFFGRRKCIESTIYLDFEKSQEEQLMLSILPKHIASEVREDIRSELQYITGHTSKKPFSKMYLKKHDDVSILYADIVNFTPLTTRLSVGELVEMLNGLFGKFDEDAKENDCLRIKILGDCYNCVSGFPTSTKDHAKNCIEMGLKMIDTIAAVRTEHDVDVDMRIGVHSGSVICGLLGIRKWQFDIWSRDVIIANHLEQSGKAGRVHISLATRQLLGEAYQYEPGYGDTGDELLASMQMSTYLVVSNGNEKMKSHPGDHVHPRATVVRKPSTVKKRNADRWAEEQDVDDDSDPDSLYVTLPDAAWSDSVDAVDTVEKTSTIYKKVVRGSQSVDADPWITKSTRKRNAKTSAGCVAAIDKKRSSKDQGPRRGAVLMDTSLVSFRKMMDEADLKMETAIDELPLNESRYSKCFLSGTENLISFLLVFKNLNWEWTFIKQTDPLFKLYMMGALTALLANAVILLIVFPTSSMHWIWVLWAVVFGVVLIITLYLWASSIRHNCRGHPQQRCLPFERFKDSFTVRTVIFLTTTVSILLCVLLNMSALVSGFNEFKIDDPLGLIWYFTYCCALSMTVAFGFYHVHFLLKLSIYLGTFTAYAFVISPLLPEICKMGVVCKGHHGVPTTPFLTHLLYLFSIVLVLHTTDRQIEFIRRMDYVWQRRLKDEEAEADTTRKVNKLLLLNILPMHVADVYLNTRRSNEQLYHEEYQSAAVMFASIQNFRAFYTENEARHSLGGFAGLEVLNEIISGFDELLFDEQYMWIEKIKIVGSTYMAACGLASSRRSTDSDANDNEANASMLRTLVSFAAAMCYVLNRLNRAKSLNFQLRIGIHQGPVIAGVVGAQKPLYDIWGHTVNTASRLEYSGEPGKIQVTEKIALQLIDEGIDCSLRGETLLKGIGGVMTFWVHAENLLLDSSSVSSAELYGSDVHFTIPPESVIAAPRKSILFCAADLQEVIFEEDESQVEELYADGSGRGKCDEGPGDTVVSIEEMSLGTRNWETIAERAMVTKDLTEENVLSQSINIDYPYEMTEL